MRFHVLASRCRITVGSEDTDTIAGPRGVPDRVQTHLHVAIPDPASGSTRAGAKALIGVCTLV